MAEYHVVTIERPVRFAFCCQGCGYGANAELTVKAEGLDAESVARAQARAEKVWAKLSVLRQGLVACPSCGWQDPAGVRRARRNLLLIAGFLLVCASPFVALGLGGRGEQDTLLVGAAIGGLGLLVAGWAAAAALAGKRPRPTAGVTFSA